MAENKPRLAHNTQMDENRINNGADGYVDHEVNRQTVGTHTPGTHQRSETAQENSEGTKQMHENRENPEKDHVPGHMGYTRENLNTVVHTTNK